jgi:hypothetical protein
MSIPIELNELEGKPVLGENLLSGTMAQTVGESPQIGDSDAQALQSHGETGTGQAQGQAPEQEPPPPVRKLQPRVKPVTVQRIGRRDLHRMICETHGMEQRPADEAIDAVLGTISDWISAMIGALEPNQRATLSIGNWGTLAITFAPKTDDKQWRINAGLPAPAQVMTMTFRPSDPQVRAMHETERQTRRREWISHLLYTPPNWPSLWGWSVIKVTTGLRSVGLPYPSEAVTHPRLRPYPPLPPPSQLSA